MTIQDQAEQFLARNGIKFRVVASDRGPGEWNVTFSRKGGGRLKLEFFQHDKPSLDQVVFDMVIYPPNVDLYAKDEGNVLIEDTQEYVRALRFFGEHGIEGLRDIQEGIPIPT